MSIRNKLHNLLASALNEPTKHIHLTVPDVYYGGVLNDKVILIVGGSKGIGLSIAKKAVQEGATVLLTGRSESSLRKAVNILGKNASYLVYDNEDIAHRDVFLNNCYNVYGKLDCVVFNAGISLHEGDFSKVTVEGFEKQVRINLESTYFLLQSLLDRCIHIDSSINIVILSSETSGKNNDLPYGLSKVAINSMIGGLSRRVCERGIRINGIAPGVTLTSMTSDKTINDNLYYNSALGRYILPEEIANVAIFLLSEASSCINGEIIFCDGGNHLKINGFDNEYKI